MSTAIALTRSFRCVAPIRRFAVNRTITSSISSINHQQQRSFARVYRDSFDEIEDRDLRSTPVSERGLTRDEFEALSQEEQDDIIAREEEMMAEEGESDEPRLLTEDEIKSLSPEDRKLYLEVIESGVDITPTRIVHDEIEEDEEDPIEEYDEHFDQWARDAEYDEESSDHHIDYRAVDDEVLQLEERFATNKKYGLVDTIDRFEKVLDQYEFDESVRDPEDTSLEHLKIDASLFAPRTERVVPQVPGLDYSQNQPIQRPRAIDSRDPNARRDPEPVLEPYGVRQERSNDEMIAGAIAAGPAVHQTSFIDHQFNTTLTPHWMNMQTANPELIAPLRGANYEDPTSVKYPFIPVLENPRDLQEASLLHRLLQYNRLDATRQFLKLERLRRQLAYQRQHRDLTVYCKKLCSKLPAERVDLKDVKPKTKNLPTYMSSEYLNEMHPHNISTETSWMHSLMWLVHDNVKDNGKLSQLEKEKYMRTTQRFCSYAYRQMMKDKAAGYYRVMSTPPMMETAEERQARVPIAPRVPTPMHSSLLRKAAILIRNSSAQ